MLIIYEGTEEEFWNKLKGLVKEVIEEQNSKKVSPLTKVQACDQLGISFNTLAKIMKEMNLDVIFPADIDHILFKYPKYIKKSIKG